MPSAAARAAGELAIWDHLAISPKCELFAPLDNKVSSHDPSFPSDHAAGAYAIAFAILLRHRKAGVIALILATLIAASRVALGTHYPTDVLGGAALGALAALALWTPPIRPLLHRLADRAGALYEGALRLLLRRGVSQPS